MKTVACLVAAAFVVCSASTLFAGDEPSHGQKIARGVVNLVTFPFEYARCLTYQVADKGPLGLVTGTAKGTIYSGARAVGSVIDIVGLGTMPEKGNTYKALGLKVNPFVEDWMPKKDGEKAGTEVKKAAPAAKENAEWKAAKAKDKAAEKAAKAGKKAEKAKKAEKKADKAAKAK